MKDNFVAPLNELEGFFPKFEIKPPPKIKHKRVLLVDTAAKFDKAYWHSALTSYNRKIGQARILLTDFEI